MSLLTLLHSAQVDAEVATLFQSTLTKQGMSFKLGTKVTASAVTGSGVNLTVEPSKGGAAETISADVVCGSDCVGCSSSLSPTRASQVLVATGRRPFTNGLGLDELGIKRDKMGRIQVDSNFRTALPNVYAIGRFCELCSRVLKQLSWCNPTCAFIQVT
jgi:dihydrolipoamide dehydrogenase